MNPAVTTILLLIISNVFMTCAWYGHFKLNQMGVSTNWPLYVVILFSWGIALIEYCFMIPANRIGHVDYGGPFTLLHIKVMQEVITLVVFVVFCTLFFEGFVIRWNHLLAFALLVAAVALVFMK